MCLGAGAVTYKKFFHLRLLVNQLFGQKDKQIIRLIQVQNADKKLTAAHIRGMDCEDLGPPNAHVRMCTDYIKN